MTQMPDDRFEVAPYIDDDREVWDEFVRSSKNATFLHTRDYMEHHDDEFNDASAIVLYKGDPIALFPANECHHGAVIESHGGLTYGGILSGMDMTTTKMGEVFSLLRGFYKWRGADVLFYKTIPHIYHTAPAEEDRYALFSHGANLYRRDVTSVIMPWSKTGEWPEVRDSRSRSIQNANGSVKTLRTGSLGLLEQFYDILEENLHERHETNPTHSFDELKRLSKAFPVRIQLWAGFEDDEMVAGTLVYLTDRVAHAQYIASTERGRELNALDAVFDCAIDWCYDSGLAFDFGISTENEGRMLNEGLVFYKESFGSRAVVHDFYELEL